MSYEEFKTQLLAEVSSRLEGEEKAYYDYSEDEETMEESLLIQEGDCPLKFGATVSSLYRYYKSGHSLKHIAEQMLEEKERQKSIKGLQKISLLKNYEAVKEDLYVRVVSEKRRNHILEHGIYKQVGDIVLGVYLRISENEGELCMTMINRSFLDKWNLSKDAVLEQALLDTIKMAPPRFYNFEKMLLVGNLDEYKGSSIEEFGFEDYERKFGSFLSTTARTNGATAIFYPGVAKQICEKLQTQEIYIVPTSIHEVAIHDARYVEYAEDLAKILQVVIEDSTLEDDILSYHIYKYDLETDEIQVAV